MPDSNSIPKIAVAIAARDASKFIGDTLDSLVRQTVKPYEVIVYDDGSIDGTASIAQQYRSMLENLKVVEGGNPVGISKARNRANAVVQSDFIAVLDADDTYLPDAIQQYSNFLAENPGVDLIYADTQVFDEKMQNGMPRRYPGFRSDRDAIRKTLGSALIPFKHSSMIYRRKSFEEIGGYDELLPIKVDVDLFLRFYANQKRVLKLDCTTSCHRKHGRQVSAKRLQGMKIYRQLIRVYEPDPLMRWVLMATRMPFEFAKLLVRG